MIIVLCMLIAIPFFTHIEAMTPQDNLPTDSFIPKAECPLSQKMQRTIENLPRKTKQIATELFRKALVRQEPLNADLLELMALYGSPVSADVSVVYGSMRFTEQMASGLDIIFKTRYVVAQLFRYGAPTCYIAPEQLIAESRTIEHQILKTQCVVYPMMYPAPVYTKPKKRVRINFIEIYAHVLRQSLPQELHTYISDKKIRPLHRLAMLAYDIQYTEKLKNFQPKDICDGRDIYAHMRYKKLSMCVIQAYTVSHIANTRICKVNIANIINKPNRHTALVATQIKNLFQCSTDTALSYTNEFIENIKKITIVDDEIFS